MNRHRPPPPPPPPTRLQPRTTAQVIKQTALIFRSHLLTFLLLAFLIHTFRTKVESGTNSVTAFIDRDPSIKSLLSRLDISGKNLGSSSPSNPLVRRSWRPRPRPRFLHLTRAGALQDDFLSGDEDKERSLFGHSPKTRPNGSFLILSDFNSKLGFSDSISDNGIRASKIVNSGFSFKRLELHSQSARPESQEKKMNDFGNEGENEGQRAVDLEFLINSLLLGRRDAASLFLLLCLLSAAYGYVILWYLVTFSWIFGIVFVVVVNDLLGRYRSFAGNLWDGSRLGLRRLSGFILMRWAVRDAFTQLLSLYFFGEIEDQYFFFKIFVRLKLLPLSITPPWIWGSDKELAGFLSTWFVVDTLLGFIFSVDSWVAIVDSRRGGEIVKEGCYLLLIMLNQAIHIKCLEAILCGSFTVCILAQIFGKLFASVYLSVLEVYFMVAWLIFYLSVRSKEATSRGRTFGRMQLEGAIADGLR